MTVRLATCAKPELAVFLLFSLSILVDTCGVQNSILCLSINSKTAFIFDLDLLQVLLGKLASLGAIVLSFMAVLDFPNPPGNQTIESPLTICKNQLVFLLFSCSARSESHVKLFLMAALTGMK